MSATANNMNTAATAAVCIQESPLDAAQAP
jgi:hypothetical protein